MAPKFDTDRLKDAMVTDCSTTKVHMLLSARAPPRRVQGGHADVDQQRGVRDEAHAQPLHQARIEVTPPRP